MGQVGGWELWGGRQTALVRVSAGSVFALHACVPGAEV